MLEANKFPPNVVKVVTERSVVYLMGIDSKEEGDAAAEIARVSSRVYGRAASTRCCALTIRDEAMSSIALVIFLVDWTDRMRRR